VSAVAAVGYLSMMAGALWRRYSYLLELSEVMAHGPAYDPVTRMRSHSETGQMIGELFFRSDAEPRPVGVIAVCIANLYALENLHGRAAFNHALFVTAGRLRRCVPETMEMGRLGEEGFLVLARSPYDLRRLEEIARVIRERLARPVVVSTSREPARLEAARTTWAAEVGIGVLATSTQLRPIQVVGTVRAMARTAWCYASRWRFDAAPARSRAAACVAHAIRAAGCGPAMAAGGPARRAPHHPIIGGFPARAALSAPLNITFPDNLPVSARREEIMAALAAHQVVIVCGETGSGKTTQLPKIALAMGRGKLHAPPGQGKLIGHTQPRRIAATSVAKRIAQELQTPLGEVVGFKVRFHDRLARDASVKLMTDGILLAETQSDPLLRAYDTIIIDEAHERSLNIDFLLGYLKQLLPRRPDLKVIVTSATIDAERFAQHFASAAGPAAGPAPVIYVSGRTFPVEQRWRSFEESRDHDLNDAIAEGVDELWRGNAAGDILVFLPGEREIREAADHLRKHLAHDPLTRTAEVLPLFARLSQAEQDRVFESHAGRRIVLATNVAETSLTVPGIRYVIDSGTARVKRYSFRSKVEQLLVEPVSQAAANQRAGRCGRVANGICIRLYDEQDFAGRPRFTDPEILRSSLAGVILRMKSLHLGAVEDFPFIDPPSRRAIADGYQLLNELGAVDDDNELTPLGGELARLPLDPRVGRVILEARQRGGLREVLVIAAALSLQDVRDRPLELQAQADQQHAKFDDEKSEFSGYVRLWQWLDESRGGHGTDHRLSNRQYEQLLRQNFINVRRVREWRDVHSQLLTVVTEHKWRLNDEPASYEQIHKAMLSGLLGNIGFKLEDDEAYLGARGIKFHRHPGAHLKKRPGRWIVCAELVETTRLFGRGIANIEPQWIEEVAGHLLKKQLLDPHWEKKAAEVVALERATLYGLVIYSGRRVPFARADLQGAREIFLREGLVGGQWETRLPFLAANQKLVKQVEEIEHKSRRQDVLVARS